MSAREQNSVVGPPIAVGLPEVYVETTRCLANTNAARALSPGAARTSNAALTLHALTTDNPWGFRCVALVFGSLAVGVRPDGRLMLSVLPAGVGKLKAVR